jgi:uncharacterized membrane protein YsdA (DUF1294 family)
VSFSVQKKLLVSGLVAGWLAAVLVGFVTYHDASYMKFFLAMNLLMLAYTLALLNMWTRRNLKE